MNECGPCCAEEEKDDLSNRFHRASPFEIRHDTESFGVESAQSSDLLCFFGPSVIKGCYDRIGVGHQYMDACSDRVVGVVLQKLVKKLLPSVTNGDRGITRFEKLSFDSAQNFSGAFVVRCAVDSV